MPTVKPTKEQEVNKPIEKEDSTKEPLKSVEQQKPNRIDKLTGSELIEMHGSKSAAIRYLGSQDVAVKDIAEKLGIRYQHARNVLTRPLKRGARNQLKVIRPETPPEDPRKRAQPSRRLLNRLAAASSE